MKSPKREAGRRASASQIARGVVLAGGGLQEYFTAGVLALRI
ncbi:MAG: hypothetical protein R3C68_09570 [Myxococcota bacterium]